jgi:hypothetical protein
MFNVIESRQIDSASGIQTGAGAWSNYEANPGLMLGIVISVKERLTKKCLSTVFSN